MHPRKCEKQPLNEFATHAKTVCVATYEIFQNASLDIQEYVNI